MIVDETDNIKVASDRISFGKFTNAASGVLCTAIVGGAIVPVVQGWAVDTYSLMSSFVVSAVCYLYIVFFALKGYKADE